MKQFTRGLVFLSFLALSLSGGSFGMAQAAPTMVGVHAEDRTAGMHAVAMDGDGASMTAPMPVCGMDFFCYLHCQGESTLTTVNETRGVSFGEKWMPACDFGQDFGLSVGTPTESPPSAFSPPGDPGRLLTLLKRE